MLISTSAVNEIFTLLCLVTDPLYACPARFAFTTGRSASSCVIPTHTSWS